MQWTTTWLQATFKHKKCVNMSKMSTAIPKTSPWARFLPMNHNNQMLHMVRTNIKGHYGILGSHHWRFCLGSSHENSCPTSYNQTQHLLRVPLFYLSCIHSFPYKILQQNRLCHLVMIYVGRANAPLKLG